MSVTAPPSLTISQTAERTGLSADTLRYYERIGLIDPVPRTSTGHRAYSEAQLEQVRFVLLLRTTGMSVRHMLDYAHLRREGAHTAGQRRALLSDHRDVLRARIGELESTVDLLDHKIETYDGMIGDTAGCADAPAAIPTGRPA